MRRTRWGLVCSFLVALLIAQPLVAMAAPPRSMASDLIVANTADTNTNSGTGCTTAANNCTLRDAIAVANADPGSTITFDPGVFPPSGSTTITLTSGTSLVITADMTINGPGTGLTIDGGCTVGGDDQCTSDGVTVFSIQRPAPTTLVSVSMSFLTILHGNAQGASGGGIDNDGNNLSVIVCNFQSNRAISVSGNGDGGGAIRSRRIGEDTTTLTVVNTIFQNNVSTGAGTSGGAILNEGGTLIVSGSNFLDNAATTDSPPFNPQGGAIANIGDTAIAQAQAFFTSNTASNTGGAIFNSGTMTLSNSIVRDNSASSGGGITNTHTMTIINTTMSGNMMTTGQSTLLNNTATLTVINSTISGNHTDSTGTAGVDSAGGGATLINTIVAGNTTGNSAVPDVVGAFNSNSKNNLIGNGSGITSGISNGTHGNIVGTSGSPVDPRFGPLGEMARQTIRCFQAAPRLMPVTTPLALPPRPTVLIGSISAASFARKEHTATSVRSSRKASPSLPPAATTNWQ